jgi:hypothetical protein
LLNPPQLQTLLFQHSQDWCASCHLFPRGKRGLAMETFINDAMVIEGALLSFFLALWMTWLGLSGLFRLIPATMRSNSGRSQERS